MCGSVYLCSHCEFWADDIEAILAHLYKDHQLKWYNRLFEGICKPGQLLAQQELKDHYSSKFHCHGVIGAKVRPEKNDNVDEGISVDHD